ncbi:MAG TPA: alpha/beta hydrolase [Deltaproteobacteria bacterium]|nr:alpha/beta hydrolase [Deltaproteobacteria bacterium]
MTMRTSKINVSRGNFNVRDRGNQDGFPVIMLHGWPESSYCWEGVAEFLDPSLRIIAPDLRGLGESERTLDVQAYQKVELAKDIIEIADTLKIDAFFLVGHDWGGIVAQELALMIPERVKKFVIMNIPVIANTKGTMEARKIICAAGGVPYWYQYFQIQPRLAEAMIKGNEDVWVPHFFGPKGQDGTIPPEAIKEYIRCYSIENTPATGASYYRSVALDAPHWATMAGKRFTMPTLYIHGSEDTVIIKENLNHIEECFDSIQVKSLPASHFVQEEKPKEVAELMNKFFS